MTETTDSTTPAAYKMPKWIAWAGFLLIGVPIIIWAVMTPDHEMEAAKDFLTALESKSYVEAFEMLSDEAQVGFGSPAALADAFSLDNWTVYKRDDGDRRSDAVDASARFNGQERRGFTVYLVQDNDEAWRIEAIRNWRPSSN